MAWIAVFILAFALRVANVFFLADTPLYLTPHGDGRVYLEWADSIRAAGLAGLFESGEVFYQDPLYPHLLAVFRAIFGESLIVLRIGQAVVGAGTAVLVGLATSRMVGRWAGIGAAALVSIHSTSIWLDGLVQKSALVGLLFGAVMLAATFDTRRGRFALGVAIGLLMLTRGEARLFALVIGTWLALGRRFDRLAVYGAGLALVLVPVLVRNASAGGEFVLTTSQAGTNFYIGNAEGSNGTYAPLIPGRGDARSEAEDGRRLAEEAEGRALSSREISTYWRGRAIDDMTNDPVAAVGRLGRKGALALSRVELADTDDLGHAASTSVVLKIGPGFALLLALAAVGLVIARPAERRGLRVPMMLAATQWVALALFFVFARYRLPLTLAILPAAGLTVVSLPRLRERAGAASLACLLALLVAFLPLQAADPSKGRAVALVNEGQALVDTGHIADAHKRAIEAVELAPELFDAHRLHALTLLRQDRSEAALIPLQLAHGLVPGDWQVRAWFGIAMGETGNLRRAYELLGPAALERPEALPIVSNAVALALGFGERAQAIELLRKRIALEPEAGARPLRLQLGWLLATSADDSLRAGAEALLAVEPLDDAPEVLDVRAAALAEMGRFDEASATIVRALVGAGGRSIALRLRRAAYAARRPWRE